MKEKVVTGVIAGALAIAFFTKPGPADFEAYVEKKYYTAQSQALAEGNVVEAFLGAGVNLGRGGRFENGILSSTYYVTYLGNPVYKCTGLFGFISCAEPK